MKLILASAGFATEEIIAACEHLVGKSRNEISVAIVNEGYAVEHNNLRWVLNDLHAVGDKFGGKLELVNLLALPIATILERLEKHDVIFVVGGHTDYLMSVFNKSELSLCLPELLEKKVYVGSSAGSMILGKRLDKKAYDKIYGERDTYGTTRFLELVDFAMMPHLDSLHFPNRKETLLEAVKDHKGVVYGLRDDCAIIIDGENITIIGSEPYILNQ